MNRTELTSSMKNPINLAFVEQLRVLRLDGFELDRYLFSRRHVCSQVNITEGTAPNLAAKPVLLSHSQLHVNVMPLGFRVFWLYSYSACFSKKYQSLCASSVPIVVCWIRCQLVIGNIALTQCYLLHQQETRSIGIIDYRGVYVNAIQSFSMILFLSSGRYYWSIQSMNRESVAVVSSIIHTSYLRPRYTTGNSCCSAMRTTIRIGLRSLPVCICIACACVQRTFIFKVAPVGPL